MRLDIAAPTEANPEAPIPCETVDAVAPSEADAEQEVLFVSAEAAAPTGPDAGLEIARGGRHVVETPVLGPTFWSGGMLHRPLSDASGVWNSGLANTFEPLVRFGSFTQPAHRMEACQDGVIPEGWPSLGRVYRFSIAARIAARAPSRGASGRASIRSASAPSSSSLIPSRNHFE